jgi:hypothetical protein
MVGGEPTVGNHHFQHFGQFQFVFWNVLSSHIHTLIEVGRAIPLSGRGDNRVGGELLFSA